MARYFKGGLALKFVFEDRGRYDLSYYFDMDLYDLCDNGYVIKDNILNNNFGFLYYEIMSKLDKPLLSDSIVNSDCYVLNTDLQTLLNSKIILSDDFKYKYSFCDKYLDLDICYIFDKDFTLKIGLLPVIWYPYDVLFKESFCISLKDAFLNNITSVLKGALWFTII